ncbi:MAG: amino acid permease [Planctomycetaceae bacterium]|nr:amino acid permease [Planctomycetaceae bacterium]
MSTAGLPERRLSMWDCTSIIVGIIIGSGIYEALGLVAGNVADGRTLAGLWIVGGLFALLGSLCYAELATRFPEEGGDFVYLTKAYGRGVGLLFAWTQLWIIRPGSIGALACVFADYATQLQPLGSHSLLVYACVSVLVLSGLNMLGVRQSTRVQNVLTAAKVLGLALLAIAGLFGTQEVGGAPPARATETNWSLAMIFVLFAYSGWNEMGCVAAEVREPRRNILRALLLGAAVVTLVYLGLNAACYRMLGLEGMAARGPIAVTTSLGPWAERALAMLVCISALGSTNGMIFTGARIYYAMGKQHAEFAALARWNPRFGTPLVSLVLQAVVTLGLLLCFGGTAAGNAPHEAFKRLVIFMTPPFYVFLILSALAVIVLRRRDWAAVETYRLPLYPLPPLVVAVAAAFLAYQAVEYVRFKFDTEAEALRGPTIWVGTTFLTGLMLVAWERLRRPPKLAD